MRKADLVNKISEKTGIPKVDVLMTLETAFREIKESLSAGENIYIRGFGSFITKKRAAKIGRNIKKKCGCSYSRTPYPGVQTCQRVCCRREKNHCSGLTLRTYP